MKMGMFYQRRAIANAMAERFLHDVSNLTHAISGLNETNKYRFKMRHKSVMYKLLWFVTGIG